jgi:hypothetical protein
MLPAFLLLLGENSIWISAMHVSWVSFCLYLTLTEPHDTQTGRRLQVRANSCSRTRQSRGMWGGASII